MFRVAVSSLLSQVNLMAGEANFAKLASWQNEISAFRFCSRWQVLQDAEVGPEEKW